MYCIKSKRDLGLLQISVSNFRVESEGDVGK